MYVIYSAERDKRTMKSVSHKRLSSAPTFDFYVID